MNYSEPASEAFQQFALRLEERLVAENKGVIKVAALWSYGYPKVAILFASKEAITIAASNALLSGLASEVSEFVRSNSVFGEHRKSLDSEKSLFFTADIEKWKSLKDIMTPEEKGGVRD